MRSLEPPLRRAGGAPVRRTEPPLRRTPWVRAGGVGGAANGAGGGAGGWVPPATLPEGQRPLDTAPGWDDPQPDWHEGVDAFALEQPFAAEPPAWQCLDPDHADGHSPSADRVAQMRRDDADGDDLHPWLYGQDDAEIYGHSEGAPHDAGVPWPSEPWSRPAPQHTPHPAETAPDHWPAPGAATTPSALGAGTAAPAGPGAPRAARGGGLWARLRAAIPARGRARAAQGEASDGLSAPSHFGPDHHHHHAPACGAPAWSAPPQGAAEMPKRAPRQGAPASSAPARTTPGPVISASPRRPRFRLWRRRRRDPAPSRVGYRLQRLWLTPSVRGLVLLVLPVTALLAAALLWLTAPAQRTMFSEGWRDLRAAVAARPEFQIHGIEVTGASAPLNLAVQALFPEGFPVSSFDIDLPALRRAIEGYDAVARAELRVAGGRIEVRLTERDPAVLWRTPDRLLVLDNSGRRIAVLADRAVRPDLAVIAGEGADAAVPEALALLAAGAPLAERLRGLERIGNRRWDVVLDRGQRILLPETGAIAALERAIALHQAQDLLNRDILALDFRNGRPVARLGTEAVPELRRIRQIERGANG